MTKKETQNLRKKLESEKEKLIKELESFAVRDKEIKGNWSARAPMKEKGNTEEETEESIEFDNLVSLERNMELKLRDVTLALEKIETDKPSEYGLCENCNKKIDPKRLQACPEARLCMKCNK